MYTYEFNGREITSRWAKFGIEILIHLSILVLIIPHLLLRLVSREGFFIRQIVEAPGGRIGPPLTTLNFEITSRAFRVRPWR